MFNSSHFNGTLMIPYKYFPCWINKVYVNLCDISSCIKD
nr:MAG TPA: hypothetical protein [Caudoviricetes sp.]